MALVNPGYVAIAAVLIIGTIAVLYGALLDRRRRRERDATLSSPPDRVIPAFSPDAKAPAYVPEASALRPTQLPSPLADDERALLSHQLTDATTVSFSHGYVHPGFVTDTSSGFAVLDEPLVLICADPVLTVRELLTVLTRAKRAGRSLVVVAPSLMEDVVRTLAVNAAQGKLAVVAVEGLPKHELLAALGATPVSHDDLVADYLPPESLGTCGRWVSSATTSWMVAKEGSPAP